MKTNFLPQLQRVTRYDDSYHSGGFSLGQGGTTAGYNPNAASSGVNFDAQVAGLIKANPQATVSYQPSTATQPIKSNSDSGGGGLMGILNNLATFATNAANIKYAISNNAPVLSQQTGAPAGQLNPVLVQQPYPQPQPKKDNTLLIAAGAVVVLVVMVLLLRNKKTVM